MSIGLIKALVIGIGLMLAVGGTVYVVTQNANTEGEASVEEQAELHTSLRSLVGSGASLVCTYEYTPEGGASVRGTTYIDDGRVRGDFTLAGEMSGESHMILKDEVIHTWMLTSSGSFGTTFAAPENTTVAGSTTVETGVALDQAVDYNCESWTPEESKFEIPSDVEFKDMSAMINKGGAGAYGYAATEVNAQGGASASVNISGGTAIKGTAAQCGSCNSIPDAGAKAQCLQSLSCN